MLFRIWSLGTCLAVLAALAVATPATAAGGPPSLVSVTPNPVPADGTLAIAGTGCAPGSPVSFYLWNTSGGVPPVYKNGTDTGWAADAAGAFTRRIALAAAFSPGSEVGVTASCTATFDGAQSSDALADGSYVAVTTADPQIDIAVAARASYGSPVTVTVTSSIAPGVIRVRLDGTEIRTASSLAGQLAFRLPAGTVVGAHTLSAEYRQADLSTPTVTDTAALTVVRAPTKVRLSVRKKRVKVRKTVALTVRLTSPGARTGRVVVKDGRKTIKTITVRSGDKGARTFKVRLKKTGKRSLTARFLGSATAAPATSSKVRVRVVR